MIGLDAAVERFLVTARLTGLEWTNVPDATLIMHHIACRHARIAIKPNSDLDTAALVASMARRASDEDPLDFETLRQVWSSVVDAASPDLDLSAFWP